jgi:hypothetical protein
MRKGPAGEFGDFILWSIASFIVFMMLFSWYWYYGYTGNVPSGFNTSNTSIGIYFPPQEEGVNLTIDKTLSVSYVDAIEEVLKAPLRINETAFKNRTYPVPFVYYDYYSPYSFEDVLRHAISLNASSVSRHAYNFVNMMANVFYDYVSGFRGNSLTEVDYYNLTQLEFSMMNPYTDEIDPSKAKNGFNLTIEWQDPSKVPLDKIELPYPVWAEYKSYKKDSKKVGDYKVVYGVKSAWYGSNLWNYGYYRTPESGWDCWNTTDNQTVCRVWKSYYSDITGKAKFYRAVYDTKGNLVSYWGTSTITKKWEEDISTHHYLYSPYSSKCWVDFYVPRYSEWEDSWTNGNTSYGVIAYKHNSTAKTIKTHNFTAYYEVRTFTLTLHYVLHDGNVSSVDYEPPNVNGVSYSYELNYPDLYVKITFTGNAFYWTNNSVHTIPVGKVYDTVRVVYLQGDKRYYDLGNLSFKVIIFPISVSDDEAHYGIKLVDIGVHPTIPPEWVKDKPPKLPLEYYEQLQTYGYYKAISDVLRDEAIDDADFVGMVLRMWEQINIVQSDEDFIDDQWIPLVRKTDTNNYGALIFAQALLQGHYWTNTFEYNNTTRKAVVYTPPAVDKETDYFITILPAEGGADDWIMRVHYYDPMVGYGYSIAGITAVTPYWTPFYVFWAPSDIGWPTEGVVMPVYRGFPFWTDYIGVNWRVRDVYVKENVEVSGSYWEEG